LVQVSHVPRALERWEGVLVYIHSVFTIGVTVTEKATRGIPGSSNPGAVPPGASTDLALTGSWYSPTCIAVHTLNRLRQADLVDDFDI
jgi:hypothetical protein